MVGLASVQHLLAAVQRTQSTQLISAPQLTLVPVKQTGKSEVNSGLGRKDQRETSGVTAWSDIMTLPLTQEPRPGGLA